MEFVPQLSRHVEYAKANPMRIVLPEGDEERVIEAAKIAVDEKMAYPTLIGDENTIVEKTKQCGLNPNSVDIIDPKTSVDIDRFCQEYAIIRGKGKKQINERAARRIITNPLFFGAMMVRMGMAGGCVAGANYLSTDVVKASVYIIGPKAPGVKISSFFLMVVPDDSYGENGALLYADCAVNPEPDAETLAEIALSTAHSAKQLFGWEPRIAMLSFSTKGSAKHHSVDIVANATAIVKEKRPDILIDGELQADAAIVASVAHKKAPDSDLAGRANILIAPNLDVGNICYKLTERLTGGHAIGPIFQETAFPIADLSRGCRTRDIVHNMIVLTYQKQFLDEKDE